MVIDNSPHPDSAAPDPPLACPVCGGTEFERQESRQDSMWGFTSHKMRLLICNRCRLVLHFYEGNSIFDFD
jgi:uncharacterized protein